MEGESEKTLLVGPEGAFGSSLNSGEMRVLSLPHPRTGKKATFVINTSTENVYEIVSATVPFSSCFIGNHVSGKSSSPLHMLSPFDIRFLLIPALESAGPLTTYHPIDSVLSTPLFQSLNVICEFKSLQEKISSIGEVKKLGTSGDLFVRLSIEKTVSWMIAKVNALQRSFSSSSSSSSSSLTSSSPSSSIEGGGKDWAAGDKHFWLRLVLEYVSDVWVSRVCKEMKVSVDEVYSTSLQNKRAKRAKDDSKGEETESMDILFPPKEEKVRPSPKKRKKVGIMKYFG
eukprot:TRINITY_DN862_c0_g2_i1.p1 TRINITY_DN862_c0_g2~~TRINITY_DN862_c0_g2_i1.p1  ORF type:complete len:309 (+),score=90.12 TRINITY_DN862_c0_g2_i1:71-928(+)